MSPSRWPIIRHMRYFLDALPSQPTLRHVAFAWNPPVHADKDYAVLDQIWRGER